MGTVENQLAQGKKKIRNMDKMKQICVLILALALITADAAPSPRKYYRSRNRSRGRSYSSHSGYNSGSNGPNRFLKDVGRTKILAGAGIGILGALTGNQQLQQAGGGLVGLGVASSLGAHLFGKKKK